MTSLKIPRISLHGSTVHALVIPAVELADYFNATSVLAQAYAEAETIQQQAAADLAKAQDEVQQILAQAHQQGLTDAADELTCLRQKLVDETLEWHVAETQLESAIAQNLDARVRALVAQTLEEFIGDQDAIELLVRRVQQRLIPLIAKGSITLRVSTDSEAKAQETFASYSQVQVIGVPSLRNTQALLETHLFTLRIDLETHLQSLLSRLRQVTLEPLNQ